MRAVTAELRKLAGLPATAAVALFSPLLFAGLVLLVRRGQPGIPVTAALAAVASLGAAGPVVAAALLAGSEYRGGQAVATALAVPAPVHRAAARGSVLGASCLAVGLATVAAGALAVGAPWRQVAPLGALFTGCGLAAGALAVATRSSFAAVGASLATLWLVPLLGRWAPSMERWLPTAAVPQLSAGHWPTSGWATAAWLGALFGVTGWLALIRNP